VASHSLVFGVLRVFIFVEKINGNQ
jgi:hypothetical protein